jgi:predicted nucleic acid-binding protein
MSILVDSNILCRLARSDDPQHLVAKQAIELCLQRREELLLTPQAQREFWVVATRPRDRNGLGLNPNEAAQHLTDFEQFCSFLPDTPAVQEHWRHLVTQHQVSGKDAHDAGFVAAMQAHGIGQILTFNAEDFQRYGRQITILTPEQLARERQQELDLQQQAGRGRDQGIER